MKQCTNTMDSHKFSVLTLILIHHHFRFSKTTNNANCRWEAVEDNLALLLVLRNQDYVLFLVVWMHQSTTGAHHLFSGSEVLAAAVMMQTVNLHRLHLVSHRELPVDWGNWLLIRKIYSSIPCGNFLQGFNHPALLLLLPHLELRLHHRLLAMNAVREMRPWLFL